MACWVAAKASRNRRDGLPGDLDHRSIGECVNRLRPGLAGEARRESRRAGIECREAGRRGKTEDPGEKGRACVTTCGKRQTIGARIRPCGKESGDRRWFNPRDCYFCSARRAQTERL